MKRPSNITIIGCFHPAYLFRYKAKAARPFLLHVAKAVKIAAGKRPDPLPKVIINPSAHVARDYLTRWKAFAIDIETPSTRSTKLLSVAVSGDPKLALVWDMGSPNGRATRPLADVLSGTQLKVFQNGAFDIPILEANGFRIRKTSGSTNLIWDTLLEAQFLHPDETANLSFLASLALDVPPWKHLRGSTPLVYNGYDACYTYRLYAEGKT